MSDFLEFSIETLKSSGLSEANLHWLVLFVAVIGLLVSGGVVGFGLNIYKFRKRAFFDQMVIGVNILHPLATGGWELQLRTLVEDNLDNLIDNPVLQRLLIRAAKKCTDEMPLIKLKDAEDHALLLTKVQNAISSFFASEHILRMLGYPLHTQWVDFVLTCERYGGLKATKVRVLVFVKVDVLQLRDPKVYANVRVESEHHADRLRTLQLIAAEHLEDNDVVHGRVEISARPE